MAEKVLASQVIQDPMKRLINRVSTCMIREPNYYESANDKVGKIISDLEEVVREDPEFVCQLACYARNSMNLRSVSNFLLAWSDTNAAAKRFLPKYFNATVKLPSDLLELVEFNQRLKGVTDRYQISNCLQMCVRGKLAEFSPYQIGKYCSEGRRKRLCNKSTQKALTEKGNLKLKTLIRLVHASKPANMVMAVLGKRYPENSDVFATSSLATEGEFNPQLANKRMKIETPVTWETELSKTGNSAEVWEKLVKTKQLPFMAMLRNLRNMLEVGVDQETHQIILSRLENPKQIEQSKLFPFRFFSAYEAIKIDTETLRKVKEDPTYQPPAPTGKRSNKPPKVKIPKEVPTPELIETYKTALDQAVKLATSLNIRSLPGHSAIFADVSGSMGCPVSGGSGLGSVRTCMDLGLIMGLMLRHVCESSEFVIFSSPSGQHQQCWLPVDLQGDDLLGHMQTLKQESNKLGGGTDFPYDYLERLIEEKRKIDYWFIFSDMMVGPGHDAFDCRGMTIEQALDKYRNEVYPEMRFVSINLAGHGRSLGGADLESDPRNIIVAGYSDAILRLVTEMDYTQTEMVKHFAENYITK